MNPFLPQSFHAGFSDSVAQRSVNRDPDGFFPELSSYQPDPVGLWLVQRSGRVSDRLQSFWSAIAARWQPKRTAGDAVAPPVEIVHWPRG
ncbi:MAG TPA: hypothetical protein VM450_02000 [Thermomicrobiales bacterium]|nr:hypothetical protein [Thermomicrobiales bacterium]